MRKNREIDICFADDAQQTLMVKHSKSLCNVHLIKIGGCLLIIGIIIFIGCFPQLLTKYDPFAIDEYAKLSPPSSLHFFGTDYLGRDLFTRVIYGIKYSVFIALIILGIISFASMLIGIISGCFGGVFAETILFLTDIFSAIPSVLLSIIVVGILGNSVQTIIIAMLISWWAKYVRLIYVHTKEMLKEPFIQLLVLNGTSKRKMIFYHIIPYILPQLITMMTLDIGKIVLMLSSLSFLGIGIQPPTPEWGVMIVDSKSYFQLAPWTFIFPSGMLLLVSFTFQICGENLKRYFEL